MPALKFARLTLILFDHPTPRCPIALAGLSGCVPLLWLAISDNGTQPDNPANAIGHLGVGWSKRIEVDLTNFRAGRRLPSFWDCLSQQHSDGRSQECRSIVVDDMCMPCLTN